jgi:Dynamin family
VTTVTVMPQASSAGGVTDIERQTRETLEASVSRLEDEEADAYVVQQIRALVHQVGEPCVVAVVGRVKAGKSTFLNALLQDDKAVTGSTETTATINHFTYGNPDAERPVRCHWRNGRVTEESEEFIASLQGNDLETLRRAEGIKHLQYLMPNEALRKVTLVDTPGTGAAVSEHESRTAEFLEAERRLRSRHHAETERIQESADAIIYLVGPVALTSDQELLDRFVNATGDEARAVNALGVIAKVDLSDTLLERRHELADKVAKQLSASLTTVLAVSAGVARAADRLAGDPEGLALLTDVVGRLTPDQLDLLLSDEELFREYDLPGCDAPATERRALRERTPAEWRVFVTLVTAAAEHRDHAAIVQALEEIGGLPRLRDTLNEYFLERGHILRCFRIARDARSLLNRIRFEHLPAARRKAAGERAQLERFRRFIRAANGSPEIAAELEEYLTGQLDSHERAARMETLWHELDREFAVLLLALGEHSADFGALQTIATSDDEFSPEELEELRALLGMYGSEPRSRLRGEATMELCIRRQLEWRRIREAAPRGSARAAVAERAHDRLGVLMDELGSGGHR